MTNSAIKGGVVGSQRDDPSTPSLQLGIDVRSIFSHTLIYIEHEWEYCEIGYFSNQIINEAGVSLLAVIYVKNRWKNLCDSLKKCMDRERDNTKFGSCATKSYLVADNIIDCLFFVTPCVIVQPTAI